MNILSTKFFLSEITSGQVYYFSSPDLNNNIPHYFICVSRTDEETVLMVVSTTQFDKKKKYIELRKLPYSTLVWIPPTEDNGLTKDSYINCNDYFSYTIEELKEKYEKGELKYKGRLEDSSFHQIIKGLKDSPMIEELIKRMLPDNDEESAEAT